MNNPTFLLIAYDLEKPKDQEHTLRKPITAEEYKTLQEDYFCFIELNNVPCEIVDRRTLRINQVDGFVCIIIIDFKRKN